LESVCCPNCGIVTGRILRLSSEPGWRFKDPYDCAVYVEPVDEGRTAILKAVQGTMPTSENRHEIAEVLTDAGFEQVGWERYEAGHARFVVYPLRFWLRRKAV
jgi:hypothetical protein